MRDFRDRKEPSTIMKHRRTRHAPSIGIGNKISALTAVYHNVNAVFVHSARVVEQSQCWQNVQDSERVLTRMVNPTRHGKVWLKMKKLKALMRGAFEAGDSRGTKAVASPGDW